MNSLGNAALAINLGSFAERFGISSGPEWTIRLKKP
jgi:S-adenosylmethionine hydrolase